MAVIENPANSVSLTDVLKAAIEGQRVEPRNEKDRDLLVVQFKGRPSWEHANVIAAFRVSAQDILHRSLRIAGGGHGAVKFDLGSPLAPDERAEIRKKVEPLMKTDFIKERFAIDQIAFKAAGEVA